MGSQVASSEVAVALDSLAAALGRVRTVGLVPVEARDAAVLVRELEGLGRQVDALRVGVVDEVDRRGQHRVDGHHSAKVFLRHHANLSDGEAARRAKAVRALRDLPTVTAAFSAGRIGADQVAVLAGAHANERVRASLMRQEADAARMAASMPFERFAAAIRDWTRLADQDGTADRSVRNHRNRSLKLRRDPDGSWRLVGTCGGSRGAQQKAILEAFLAAEFDVDWARARAEKGDQASAQDLARTDDQRAADAMHEIFQAAADAHAAKAGGSRIVTNIVIDHATFERELRRLAGQRAPHGDLPLDPDGHTRDSDAEPLPWDDLDENEAPPDGGEPEQWPVPDPDADLAGSVTGPAGSADFDAVPTPDRNQPVDDRDLDATGPDDRGGSEPDRPVPEPDEPADDDLDGDGPGGKPPPHPPDDHDPPDPPAATGPGLGFRSSTLDGEPVDPREAVAQALLGHVRRVVIGADSVVIDLGRTQRCFTGLAALAVKLNNEHCTWPGCHVPTTQTQNDHLTAWANGGRTNPGNGAPLCGHHNRTKEHGYRITRDENGRLHTYRPDGTEIT